MEPNGRVGPLQCSAVEILATREIGFQTFGQNFTPLGGKNHETTKKSHCNYWKRLKAKIGLMIVQNFGAWVVKIHFPDGSMDVDGGRKGNH